MGGDMERILVVDDEEDMLLLLNALFSEEGYDVVTISDGEKARDVITTEDFDLMVCDIRMRPVNGLELLELATRERPLMAVVMLTAYGAVDTAEEAKKLGAFDYVSKPFEAETLLLTIRRALEYKAVIKDLEKL